LWGEAGQEVIIKTQFDQITFMVRGTWNPARVYTQETTTLQINTYINHRTNEKVFLKRKRPENTGVYVCAHLPSRDKPRKDFHLPSSIL
jgi:hypothetical protein